jgi:predicted nucleic-acid-binding Zn-ribbon protein
MTIYKKGTCSSDVTVSSQVYVCSKCGYTEVKSKDSNSKLCLSCNIPMNIISSKNDSEDNSLSSV